MRPERLGPGGTPEELAAALRALVPGAASVADDVRQIVGAVRAGGDLALRDYVERFDATGGAPLRVTQEELEAALDALDGEVRAGLEVAIANVRAVAEAGVGDDRRVDLPQGHTVTLREIPVQRAAVYAPGGRNPYPSTVVMGAVTARAAGVQEVVVCAPGAQTTTSSTPAARAVTAPLTTVDGYGLRPPGA